jgi:hypothetical protein
MLFWVIKIIIFSITFIFLIHNIINFLLETLTVSKTKDMIQITNNNYKNIYEVLSHQIQENITPIDSLPNTINTNTNTINTNTINTNTNTINTNTINTISSDKDDDMKNKLTNYLREQLNNS